MTAPPAAPAAAAAMAATAPAGPAGATLLVTGVVRNGERRMRRDLEALRRATAGFRRVRWLVVEGDSDDRTVDLLRELAASWPDFDFISLGRTRDRLPDRLARIANARNAYLDALRDDPRHADVTHLLVADLDGVCGALTPEALASCWRLPVDWSMCAANQGDYYYDVFALRHPDWCPDDPWAQHGRLAPLIGTDEADNLALFARMVHLRPDGPPIEVHSAFGGLALYRREAALAGRYSGVGEDGQPVCEHVPFHAQLRAAGHRLYIHPGLVNARRTRHAGRKKFWRTLRRRAWRAVQGVFGRRGGPGRP